MKPISRTATGCLSVAFLVSAAFLFGAVALLAALLIQMSVKNWSH